MKRRKGSITRRITPLVISVCLSIACLALPGQLAKTQTTKITAKVLHAIDDGYPPFWWSPDSKTLAWHNKDLFLYDPASKQVRTEIKSDPATIRPAVYFMSDGHEILVQSDKLQVYDATDAKLLRKFAEGTFQISTYVGPTYSGDDDSASSSEILQGLVDSTGSSRPISPDGNYILVGANDERAQVYDLRTGELKFTLESFVAPGKKRHPYGYARGEFSPDGKFITTANGNKTPRLWNAATGELIANLTPQTGDVYEATFSFDSKFILTPAMTGSSDLGALYRKTSARHRIETGS